MTVKYNDNCHLLFKHFNIREKKGLQKKVFCIHRYKLQKMKR